MKIAAFIFSCSRPAYLQRVLSSLENQTEMNVDHVLMQDGCRNRFSGAVYATPEQLNLCVKHFDQAELKNKFKIVNDINRGMAWQKRRAYKYAFEDEDYDACLCFEDDLVVSKYYVRLLRVLLHQFKDDPGVATVQLSDRFNDSVRPDTLNHIKPMWRHFWGYGTWKDRWVAHKPNYDKYFALVRNKDYRGRPHGKIQKLLGNKHTSHDAALDWCIKMQGQVKLAGLVSRATYIGEAGVHQRPAQFEAQGYKSHLSQKIEFPEDASIDRFEVV